MSNSLIILGLMIILTFIGATGSLFLKLGSKNFHLEASIKNIILFIMNWKIIIGIILYGISSILFIIVLKMTDLSIAYPMTSMSYVFVTILSYKFLKEKINKYKIIGIILIITGVTLVKL
ncbi:MAG: EamA family transporter [Candidatus Woesearchaeota archaeon]